MKPPRALWVSFPLGRPLGNPNDPKFQRDVITHALNLLTAPSGPVLQDYPHDCAEPEGEPALPACPVDFSSRTSELSSSEKLLQQFQSEFNSMYTWYTMAIEQKGRTTQGVSGLAQDEMIQLYKDFISDNKEGLLRFEVNLADTLRLVTEDLKSCYFEAISSQPNQPTDAATLADWFWGQTHAALVINEVRKKCLSSESKEMTLAGKLLLIPRNQMHRFEE